MVSEELLKKLEDKTLSIKLNALSELKNLAKKGENIKDALNVLNELLLSKRSEIWQEIGKIMKYYYQYFVSFYCRNYNNFPQAMEELLSSRQDIRKKAAQFLTTFMLLSEPRRWNLINEKRISQLTKELESNQIENILKVTAEISDLAKEYHDITPFTKYLEEGLANANEQVRWNCANALGYYISNYIKNSTHDYTYVLKNIRNSNQEEKLSFLDFLGSSTAHDLVSDRDERDISHALPLVGILLFDKNMQVREEAIKVLLAATNEHSLEILTPVLVKVLLDIKMSNIHEPTASIFKDLIRNGLDISPFLDKILEIFTIDNNEDLKLELILILRKAVEEELDVTKSIPMITNLLDDRNEKIKFGAADTLSYFYARTARWKDLESLLQHEDKDVRQEAAGTLKVVKKEYDLTPIISKLMLLLKDQEKEVRFIAARTLLNKFKVIEDITSAIPLMAKFTSDSDPNLVNNAFIVLSNWIRDNITCKSPIPRVKWHHVQPFIHVMENRKMNQSRNIKKAIIESLAQYYVHVKQFDKIKVLLKKASNQEKKDIMYRLTTCGYFTCEVDVSPMIPELLELFFNHKNLEVKNYSLRIIEDILTPKTARETLKVIQKYSINSRWDLEKKLRHFIKREDIQALSKDFIVEKKEQLFDHYLPLLSDEDSIIREWATDELWNFIYNKGDYFLPAIPILIENLKDKDVYVRHITTLLMSEVVKHYNVPQIIPVLTELLLDDSDKVRQNAAFTLDNMIRSGYDIKETIPNLLKNVSHSSKEVRYFAVNTPIRYVQDKKSALLVLEQLNLLNLNKKDEEIKKIMESCVKFLNEINTSLEKLIRRKSGTESPSIPQKFAYLIQLWNENWGSSLSNRLIDMLIETIFQSRAIKAWNESLTIFFVEAERIISAQLKDPTIHPALSLNVTNANLLKIQKILKDSVEYAEQEEWDSIFDFNDL